MADGETIDGPALIIRETNRPRIIAQWFANGSAVLYLRLTNQEFIRAEPNGDFFVRGTKVDNDMDLYKAFREWLSSTMQGSP